MGRSRPTNVPIQSGWSLSQCPVLLDSGACVPMPFLMSLKALELSCPGVVIHPIDPATQGQLSAANGSPLELIGSVNLHFWFSGPSIESHEDGEWAYLGSVMQHWYLAVPPYPVTSALYNLQVRNDNSHILYRMLQLWGDYQNKPLTNFSPKLTSFLLQEGGSDPLLAVGQLV